MLKKYDKCFLLLDFRAQSHVLFRMLGPKSPIGISCALLSCAVVSESSTCAYDNIEQEMPMGD